MGAGGVCEEAALSLVTPLVIWTQRFGLVLEGSSGEEGNGDEVAQEAI